MSQNRKRPVTYGKSSVNRAGVGLYMLDSDASSQLPRLRTSPSNGQAAKPTSHPTSSGQPIRPSFAKNLSGSSLAQGGAHSGMQRKRRKPFHEEAHRDNTEDQLKADFLMDGSTVDPKMRDEEDLLSTVPSHDGDRKSTDILRSSRSHAPLKVESPQRTAPSPPTSEDRSRVDFLDAQNKIETASPRKRLIDSLGMTEDPHRGLTPGFDDAPELSPYTVPPEGRISASARQFSTRNNTEPRVCNVERSQTAPTSSLSSMLRSSRVTYSRQRSFLNDLVGMTGDEPQGLGDGSKFEPKPEAHGLFASRVPPEDEDSNKNKAVRSIHELRQAGDNARFREIVDSIFEDIEDQYNSISGRCCSIADLCDKLLDSQFAHRFSEQGFDERLVNCIAIHSNIVWISLAFSAFQLIIAGGQASRVFMESLWVKIIDHSPLLLDTEDDLLVLVREPSQGLSKTAQAAVRGIRSRLLPQITAPSTRFSPRLLALRCMESALRLLRETGHTARLAPTALLDTLLDLLATNGLADPGQTDHSKVLRLIFSILENYSIVTGPFDEYHCQCLQRLAQLHGLFSLDLRDQTRSTLLSYVRVILNLTNKEPALCDSFALPDLVSGLVRIIIMEFSDVSKHFGPSENDALNAVILALGTLINLTEETEKARAMLVHSNFSAVPPLQQLLEQFSGSVSAMDQARSVPEVHENVVAGYLSILFLTICLNPEACLFVKKSLDGEGLAMVFSTAEKFLQYHREIEKETGVVEIYEGESRLTRRLEHIISQARQLEGVSDRFP
ncbi:wings apart-like protein regulation of heterochromatin-domain-containing protein [Aspergillus granulosus]|uniref:Wings apart-like protein regulation of heterochromatin-domain-containing protein n=1 Tax=Aspergillus granulosus TaxID=176169 RepID=A0ABR4H223_9EURO